MKLDQIAAQFYTVRDFCKTAPEFAVSCRKVRAIGYTAIQISGVGPIPEEEILRICDGEGLTVCATHEPPDILLGNPEKVVERLRKLRCKYTAYPHPAGVNMAALSEVENLAARLDASGAVLAEAGLVLTYHNHAKEFVKHGDRTALDVIYEKCAPQHLQGELDTYWIQVGGGDPAAWCRKLNGRLPLLHMKDCVGTAENAGTYAEIGRGNLNFAEIVSAAEASGCQWFIVEQDTCPGDPFDSLKISFDYIAAHLVR